MAETRNLAALAEEFADYTGGAIELLGSAPEISATPEQAARDAGALVCYIELARDSLDRVERGLLSTRAAAHG